MELMPPMLYWILYLSEGKAIGTMEWILLRSSSSSLPSFSFYFLMILSDKALFVSKRFVIALEDLSS